MSFDPSVLICGNLCLWFQIRHRYTLEGLYAFKLVSRDARGLSESSSCILCRLAAILLKIDANELNNVFASRHYIIFKIGEIGNVTFRVAEDVANLLSCSEHAFSLLQMVLTAPAANFAHSCFSE